MPYFAVHRSEIFHICMRTMSRPRLPHGFARRLTVKRKGIEFMTNYDTAHTYCTNNKASLLQDSNCGCFYCLNIFHPKEITEWIEDTGETAVCPYCSVDSVIGAYSGYPITKEFLSEMHRYWFDS